MQRLVKVYFEDISSKHLEKKETAIIRQLHKVLTFSNKEFMERDSNSTREREVDVERTNCCNRAEDNAQFDENSDKRMSTLKRTLSMHAPITDEYMEMLEMSEEVSIGDFINS